MYIYVYICSPQIIVFICLFIYGLLTKFKKKPRWSWLPTQFVRTSNHFENDPRSVEAPDDAMKPTAAVDTSLHTKPSNMEDLLASERDSSSVYGNLLFEDEVCVVVCARENIHMLHWLHINWCTNVLIGPSCNMNAFKHVCIPYCTSMLHQNIYTYCNTSILMRSVQ